MAIRVNKLLTELNVELETLEDMLNTLGYEVSYFSLNTLIADNFENLVRGVFSNDIDLWEFIEIAANKNNRDNLYDSATNLKIVGRIDLDAHNNPKGQNNKQELMSSQEKSHALPPLVYSEKQSFWINELAVLSPENKVNSIRIGSFDKSSGLPLYSVLIGTNGAGKSLLMKEIVDFFIDLHACVNKSDAKLSPANKGWLKGIKYHIDGVVCEVIRLEKSYLAKIDGHIRTINDLRLPSIVACHFGAFDKFPTQTVNGSPKTRYDVPFYKYVGAHVNGSMISSSAIAFRLLFALNEKMDDRRRKNICSILDFIGYDHRISLSYTLVMKSKKDGAVREMIAQRVEKDKEYSNLNKQEKNGKVTQLYNFYKNKTSLDKTRNNYNIDFDTNSTSVSSFNELQYVYKLKQCNLVSSVNVIFHKQECDIASDEMSSGEFAMLSTVLSVSSAVNDPHTLVLLDEPELSLHPNWQMTAVDNFDRALANQVCHLLIATHSHMLVSDLPLKRSVVTQVEKDEDGELKATTISESTYGWSAEEVLLKVFKTATDRNRYFGERIGKLLEKMGNNSIMPQDVADELKELQEISMHLSDIDPMKTILNTIIETYK